jgi:probable rRNA maturation factor
MRKPVRYSARLPKARGRKSLLHKPQRRNRAPAIDIIVASVRWKAERNARTLVKRAIVAAASAAATAGGEVAIVLTDDAAIRALNRNWRKNNAATNVLSFPANGPGAGGTSRLLGDIVIAYETTEREARAERKPFAHHLTHLAVHGFLHLVGYDHVADDEAETMEGLETRILDRLGVPDPYTAR